ARASLCETARRDARGRARGLRGRVPAALAGGMGAVGRGARSPDRGRRRGGGSLTLSELFRIDGKVAIVKGGATGIGRQFSGARAEAGADVVVCGRDRERCERVAAELGGRALGLGCDLRKPEEIEEVVRRTREELGRIDILVNNSGTAWGAPAEEVPL